MNFLKDIKSLFKNKILILFILLMIVALIYFLLPLFNIHEGLTFNTPNFYKNQLTSNTNPKIIDSSNYKQYNNIVITGTDQLIIKNFDNKISDFLVYYYYTGSPTNNLLYSDEHGTQTQPLIFNKVIDDDTVTINKIILQNGNFDNRITTIPLILTNDAPTPTTSPIPSTVPPDTTTATTAPPDTTTSPTGSGSGSESGNVNGSGNGNLLYNITKISSGSAVMSPSG